MLASCSTQILLEWPTSHIAIQSLRARQNKLKLIAIVFALKDQFPAHHLKTDDTKGDVNVNPRYLMPSAFMAYNWETYSCDNTDNTNEWNAGELSDWSGTQIGFFKSRFKPFSF